MKTNIRGMTLIELIVAFTVLMLFLGGALQVFKTFSSASTVNLIRERMLNTVNMTGQYINSLNNSQLAGAVDIAEAFKWNNLGLTDAMTSAGTVHDAALFKVMQVHVDSDGQWLEVLDNTGNWVSTSANTTDAQNAVYSLYNGTPTLMLGGFWSTGAYANEKQNRQAASISYVDNLGQTQNSIPLPSPISYNLRAFQETYPATGLTFYRIRCEVPPAGLISFYPNQATAATQSVIRERLRVELVFQQK